MSPTTSGIKLSKEVPVLLMCAKNALSTSGLGIAASRQNTRPLFQAIPRFESNQGQPKYASILVYRKPTIAFHKFNTTMLPIDMSGGGISYFNTNAGLAGCCQLVTAKPGCIDLLSFAFAASEATALRSTTPSG
jgi:hypothetical protein